MFPRMQKELQVELENSEKLAKKRGRDAGYAREASEFRAIATATT
jgi:hypothetical protein